MRISRWQWLAEKEIDASQRTVSITVIVSVRDLPHDSSGEQSGAASRCSYMYLC